MIVGKGPHVLQTRWLRNLARRGSRRPARTSRAGSSLPNRPRRGNGEHEGNAPVAGVERGRPRPADGGADGLPDLDVGDDAALGALLAAPAAVFSAVAALPADP